MFLAVLCGAGLSKAETQPLTNYGSGEDENELEEVEEFEAGPVEVQTSLQASSNATNDNKQVCVPVSVSVCVHVRNQTKRVFCPDLLHLFVNAVQ